MHIEFYEPDGGYDPQVVCDMLTLAGVVLPAVTIATWTDLERIVAYDWAAREHLRASDHRLGIMHRPKPWFVTQAEEMARVAAEPVPVSPRNQLLAFLVARGAAGATYQLMVQSLPLPRGTIQVLTRSLMNEGLVEHGEFGRWKVTAELIEQMA